MLGQNRQEQLLREHILADYGIQVEWSTELKSFEQQPDHVLAHVVKVVDSKTVGETFTVDWQVGADGARGVVRKQLGLTFLGESPEMAAVTGDSIRCFHAAMRGTREKLPPRNGKAFHEITGRRDIEFGQPNIRMVDRFGEGRVFLVGDAAYVHSPTGGQGMNSSALKILLDSYSQERPPVIAAILNKTTELFQKKFVGKAGQKQEFVRGYELRQLGINYRGAPLVSDEKFTDKDEVNDPYRSGDDGTVRAGDRVPEAPCLAQLGVDETSSTVSLFDLLNTTQHSALVFPGSTGRDFADEVIGTLREYPSNLLKSIFILPRASDSASSFTLSDTTLVDTEGHAYSGYDVAHDTPTVFIFRPDGYIGALVTSGRLGIRNYLSRIFL
ncbi:monooxygenase [Lentinula edodes]|nr:monooxygenase [Lentinula edodes]